MTKNLNLRQFAEKMLAPMEENFREHGELSPTWIIEGSSGLTVVGTPWQNRQEKEWMVAAVKQKMHEYKATRYVQIAEVWMHDGELPKGLNVSDLENRREAVIAIAEDKSGRVCHISRPIIRSGENVMLGDPVYYETDNTQVQGLMSRLLED